MADIDLDLAKQLPHSSSGWMAGFADAREKPATQTDEDFDPTAPGRRLVAIAHERVSGTVQIRSVARAVTELLKTRAWATLDRSEGVWTIPARYLEHVEKLLNAAEVDLFDVDGAPTPGRRRELAEAERGDSAALLAELRAKREWCEAHTAEIERARRAARDAFHAVAPKPTDDNDEAIEETA